MQRLLKIYAKPVSPCDRKTQPSRPTSSPEQCLKNRKGNTEKMRWGRGCHHGYF